jgi:protein SCO1/2
MLASTKLQRVLGLVLLGLLAAIAIVVLGGRHSTAQQPAAVTGSPFDGGLMPPNLRAPNFTLEDQNGRPVTLARDLGKVVVLTFIYSKCTNTCPFMVEQIKGALNDLPGNGANIPTIGVSVKPWQDTAANRRAFLVKHQMQERMAFVNGSRAAMAQVWHDYAIQPVTAKVDHSAFVILIDPRGYERVGFAADQLTPEGLAHDIRLLQRRRGQQASRGAPA